MTTSIGHHNWMSGIDPTTPLCKLSIPGTHDTCAIYDKAHGGYKQTQWLSVTEQLNRGIRFLDIRCKYQVDGEPNMYFPIHHGPVFQNIDFAAVQAQCVAFLVANPSEFILMNVQQEESSVDGGVFGEKFDELIKPYAKYWDLSTTPRTLGEYVEDGGKIVLIRTYDEDSNTGWWSTSDIGLAWNGFFYDGFSENATFKTQNGSAAWHGQEKGNHVEEYIEAADANAASNLTTLNFLTYNRTGETPGNNAAGMNPRIRDFINGLNPRPTTVGVLPIDFVANTGDPWSDCLEDAIIRANTFMPGYEFAKTDSQRGVTA
jgi:1-phosphatidylinositol phosphodiesterase